MLRDLEVLRVSTNGTPNACSFLLGACAKAGKALGYSRIQTFTLESEGGGSLRGAGWILEDVFTGRSWNQPSRQRSAFKHSEMPKMRWYKNLCDPTDFKLPTFPDPESDQLMLWDD